MGDKDQLFSQPYSHIKAFAFDEKVVAVFPDMIKRSVPGYDTILKGTAMLAMNHVQAETQVYDLGASLGAVSLTIDQAIGPKSIHIHAVDNSPPMIASLTEQLSALKLHNRIDAHCADVADFSMNNASMVVSNFTLQFMPVASRAGVCEAIYQALNPGGVFVLSEKILSSQTMIDYYHGYKKVNGYSDMEIAQKRQALEDSLKPDSLETWQQRLRQAGFQHTEVWFKAFNFVSMVAIK
ncbi:carboxy-S-adenosyl-L-methionine synthase CmoA [Marinicella meishanensis]|uniref:carboxy-S-adenosyl-L-methionine synthase CmoA n=1 Tax=Marinicella meishanensis TaxID=2873263 RepID=UPI001CBAE20A|nr:carboxy-S-adenosyl-L-methionine synthase CmoA [Marinicella sp. NBU2979]